MKTITVTPLTQWAKNRVRQHGSTLTELRRVGDAVLVESIGDTFRLMKGRPMEKWLAWLIVGVDVEEKGGE